MRTFRLHRKSDLSGMSGTGVVAEGVEFHDGQCTLSWFGRYHSVEVWPSLPDLLAVHGHGDLHTSEVVFVVDESIIPHKDYGDQ